MYRLGMYHFTHVAAYDMKIIWLLNVFEWFYEHYINFKLLEILNRVLYIGALHQVGGSVK